MKLQHIQNDVNSKRKLLNFLKYYLNETCNYVPECLILLNFFSISTNMYKDILILDFTGNFRILNFKMD